MTTVCTKKKIPFSDAEVTVRKREFLAYTLKDHIYTQQEAEKLVQEEVEKKLLLLQRQQYKVRGKTWHMTKPEPMSMRWLRYRKTCRTDTKQTKQSTQ